MLEEMQNSNLKLSRYPIYPNDKFLAWDAADKYILNHLLLSQKKHQNILIIEDNFGAITLGLKAEHIFCVNDSILSRKGIIYNFQKNNIEMSNISFLTPYEDFPEDIDLIILKIPKVNRYLEFLLHKLNTYYSSDTSFIAGSMLKYLNTTIYELFNSYCSEFRYSLTWKKAKIITGKLTGNSIHKEFKIILEEFEITLINFPNLFSANSIDIGTRFLLENFNKIQFAREVDTIIDVGSGNGILGLSLLPHFPQAHLCLTDISYSAYESAMATIQQNNYYDDRIDLVIDNSLDYFKSNFADLIVINPPFHENHKVSLSPALAIFNDCARVLKNNGQLIIVANKHLGYHAHLTKSFSQVQVINKNEKFVIISALSPF